MADGKIIEEPNYAVTISPKIWERIFDQLKHVRDLKACYNTCSTFQTILSGERPLFLFPDVIRSPILDDLEVEDLVHCRQVCRTWKAAIDILLLSHPAAHFVIPHKTWLPDYLEDWSCWMKSLYVFESLEDLHAYHTVRKGWTNCNNVFITGSVTFDDSELNDQVYEFWSLAGMLIEKFGRRLNHLRLVTRDLHWVYFYENVLARMTPHVPYLRSISIITGNQEEVRRVDCTEFDRLVESCPLPHLAHLVELRVKHFPSHLMHHIFKCWGTGEGSKVRTLLVSSNYRERARFDFSQVSKLFPKVEVMAFPAQSMNCLKTLTTQPILPLDTIYTSTRISEETFPNFVTFPKLFQFFKEFGNTLAFLSLFLTGNTTLDGGFENRNLRLMLPKLRVLDIKTNVSTVSITSLDFIEKLKDLRVLKLTQASWDFDKQERRSRGTIEFAGYVTRMQESNIWKVLPVLREIEFRGGTSLDLWKFTRPRIP